MIENLARAAGQPGNYRVISTKYWVADLEVRATLVEHGLPALKDSVYAVFDAETGALSMWRMDLTPFPDAPVPGHFAIEAAQQKLVEEVVQRRGVPWLSIRRSDAGFALLRFNRLPQTHTSFVSPERIAAARAWRSEFVIRINAISADGMVLESYAEPNGKLIDIWQSPLPGGSMPPIKVDLALEGRFTMLAGGEAVAANGHLYPSDGEVQCGQKVTVRNGGFAVEGCYDRAQGLLSVRGMTYRPSASLLAAIEAVLSP